MFQLPFFNSVSVCCSPRRHTHFFFCFVLSSLPNSFSLIFISSLFVDLLKHKSRPEDAAEGAAEWVKCEREMRERLAREREARELKEKAEVGCLFNYVFS